MRKNNRKPIKCECGITVNAVRGIPRAHFESTPHRQAKRIRALLSQPCMTLELIGERLGITRERVRQIANQIGIDTSLGARWSVCALDRRERKRIACLRTRVGPVICEQLDALKRDVEYFNVGWAVRIKIEGIVCAFSTANVTHENNPGASYYHFHRPYGDDYDYLILVACKTTIYVVPCSWLPHAIFVPLARSTFHRSDRDWEQWREAWHLLAKAKSEAA